MDKKVVATSAEELKGKDHTEEFLCKPNEAPKVNLIKLKTTREKEKKIELYYGKKIQYDEAGMQGRNKEVKHLEDAFDRIISEGSCAQELIFLSGESGTGKTVLANCLKDKVRLTGSFKGIFVTGKHDLNLSGQPFVAISSACTDICRNIIELKRTSPSIFDFIKQELVTTIIGLQMVSLAGFVPLLKDIVGKESVPDVIDSDNGENSKGRTQLLFLGFLCFFRIISQKFACVVIVLDDLQWADPLSLDLLESIISDKSIHSLLTIGCYRSNEIDESHLLSKKIKKFHEMCTGTTEKFRITSIVVGNLDVQTVESILLNLLSPSNGDLFRGLAKICHKRTLGNAFHIKTLLLVLEQQKFISFETASRKWQWNNSVIEQNTVVSSNLAQLLISKMGNTSSDLTRVLKVASCLGHKFKKSHLRLVWEEMSAKSKINNVQDFDKKSDEKTSRFEKLFVEALEEQLLEITSESFCRFTHDKVQETAMSLIPAIEFDCFQYDVGMILRNNLDDHEMDEFLFMVVDILNKSNRTEIDIANLNLRASLRAHKLSSFSSAFSYAEYGIANLVDNQIWKLNKEMASRLYSLGAETALCVGDQEKCMSYCHILLQNTDKISFSQKLDAKHIALTVKRQFKVASQDMLNLCLDVLDELGCTLPRRRISALCYLLFIRKKTISMVKSKFDTLHKLPLLQEQHHEKREVMRFLILAGTIFFQLGNIHLNQICNYQLMFLTIKYGETKYLPHCFVNFAKCLVHEIGDYKRGKRLAEIAVEMAKKSKNNSTISRVLWVANMYIFNQVNPISNGSKNFFASYEAGMLAGDLDSAFNALYCLLFGNLICGKCLQNNDEDLCLYISQMKDLKLVRAAKWSGILHQYCLNLIGREENYLILSGNAFNRNTLLEETTNVDKQYYIYCQNDLHMFFAEYELVADAYTVRPSGEYLTEFELLPSALCLYAASRKKNCNKKNCKKYRKHANNLRSMITKWVRNGNVNFVHIAQLLKAEHLSFSEKTHQEAKIIYRAAIRTAVRIGFTHHAALACERFADFCLQNGETDDASYYMKKAIDNYDSWGAKLKVTILKNGFPELLL